MLLTEYEPNLMTKINQEHAYMMLYDILMNSSCVINVAYFIWFSYIKSIFIIYFVKYFLITAQLPDFLHYDVAKLN